MGHIADYLASAAGVHFGPLYDDQSAEIHRNPRALIDAMVADGLLVQSWPPIDSWHLAALGNVPRLASMLWGSSRVSEDRVREIVDEQIAKAFEVLNLNITIDSGKPTDGLNLTP